MEKTERIKCLDSPAHKLVEKYIQVTHLQRSTLDQLLSRTGVYRSQHQILMYVSDHPNASQKEIAARYKVSTATIAVSLKKLENGGYIRRIVDQKDNRFNQICLTEKGKKVTSDSAKIFECMEKQMFAGFSDQDYQALEELLDRIYENLEQGFATESEREEL